MMKTCPRYMADLPVRDRAAGAQPGHGRDHADPADHLPAAVHPVPQGGHGDVPPATPTPIGSTCPSLFAAMGLFSGLFAGFALLGALRAGVITRCRVTPVSRVGLLLGRALMYVLLVGSRRWSSPWPRCRSGCGCSRATCCSRLRAAVADGAAQRLDLVRRGAAGARTRTALGALVNTAGQPISLLAGVLIPLAVAPLWVQRVACWNPFAWGTNGMRALFNGQIWATTWSGRARRSSPCWRWSRGLVVPAVRPRKSPDARSMKSAGRQ